MVGCAGELDTIAVLKSINGMKRTKMGMTSVKCVKKGDMRCCFLKFYFLMEMAERAYIANVYTDTRGL